MLTDVGELGDGVGAAAVFPVQVAMPK